jgi:hypothetical protein
MIGGIGMASDLRDAHATTGFSGIPERYAELVYALRGPNSSKKTVVGVVIPVEKSFYERDFLNLSRHLTHYGIDLVCIRPSDIQLVDGMVYAKAKRIDIIHRFFRLSELSSSEARLLKRITREHIVPFIQPWVELLEEKSLMALLHDPESYDLWREALGDKTFQILRKAIPPTFVVESGPLYDSLIDTCPKQRPYWLKKSGNTWGGRSAYFGESVTNVKWRTVSQKAIHDTDLWVLQKNVSQKTEHVLYYVGKHTVGMSGFSRINPFCILSGNAMAVADVRTTIRKNHKVHGATDACFLPATL